MRRLLLLSLLLSPLPAAAQQPSPVELSLQTKLMQELNAGLSCMAQSVDLQRKSEALTAEVKRLSDKYEAASAKPEKEK